MVSWFVASSAWCAEDWYWQGRGQLLFKDYSGSTQLKGLSGLGVFFSGDYLERWGVAAGYNFNRTRYQSGLTNAPQYINENIFLISGKRSFYPDSLPGKVSLRLDAYVGKNATSTRITIAGPPMGGGSSHQTTTTNDKVMVANPIVSFLNYDKTFYLDLGYAYSTYRSDDSGTDDIDVAQWTPTLGFGFNRAYDWLQLRAYFIHLSSSNRVGDKQASSALEARWTHWFSGDAPLGLHNVSLTMLSGERIYAVDSDAFSLYSVSDLQTATISIGAGWNLSEQTSVLVQGGHEAYKDILLNDRYSSIYLYASLSQNW